MPTTYGIVYATATSAIRRIIADDHGQVTVNPNAVSGGVVVAHPDGSSTTHKLLPGESAINHAVSGSAVGAHGPAQWKQAVQAVTGVSPPDTASALVDSSNMAQQVIDWAIQAHGGAGVCQDFEWAAAWANSRTLRLADGPDEVHREAVAKLELMKHTEHAGSKAGMAG